MIAAEIRGRLEAERRELRTRIASKDADIEDALTRIDCGTYGMCVDCGRRIAPERLAVLPQAARCLDCQRRVEA